MASGRRRPPKACYERDSKSANIGDSRQMKSKVWFAATAAGAFALFSAAAGCSEKTEQAAEQTAQGVAQDAQNHTQAAGQAVEKTGEAVVEGAQEAGEAVSRGAEQVAQGASQAVESGAKELGDAGQVLTLTPKVKNALYADEKISGYKLNVDTSGEKDTITIKGGPVPAAEKARITKVAKQAVGDAKIKINNQVTTR